MSEYRKTLLDEWPPGTLWVPEPCDETEYRAGAKHLSSLSQDAVVVVSDAMTSLGAQERSLADIPMAVPPFRSCWVDIKGRDLFEMGGTRTIDHCGVLFETDLNDASVLHPEASGATKVITCFAVSKWNTGHVLGPLPVCYGVGTDGTVLPGQSLAVLGMQPGHRDASYFGDISVLVVTRCAFVLSLMHCRNVTRREVVPPRALSKRNAERRGRPLVRYYTLDIEPMRKVLRTEGRMDEVGLKRALHICRGHFKDYRDSGGLFGRHKGLYWWDANVRGSVEGGVVAKDYSVKSPGSSEP